MLGLCHGLLVTKLRLQPFLVTLCGLFIYRGLARWLSSTSVGLAVDAPPAFLDQIELLRNLLVKGQYIGVPQVLVLLVIVSIFLGLFLHGTALWSVPVRHRRNKEAARYAGIPTDRYKILADVICSSLAGLGKRALYSPQPHCDTHQLQVRGLNCTQLREQSWEVAASAVAKQQFRQHFPEQRRYRRYGCCAVLPALATRSSTP